MATPAVGLSDARAKQSQGRWDLSFPSINFVCFSSILRFHPIWELGLILLFFQDLAKCTHFEWIDEYIRRIKMEGATLGFNLPSAVEQLGSAATVGKSEGVEEEMAVKELKKNNKQLVKLVTLKKQDNLMAGLFYFCVISLSFVYLLIISR
jgi:hypothetical protein